MKVGILTFTNSISYGAVLQMYATYNRVAMLGHEPEIINYYNSFMKSEGHLMKDGKLRKKNFIRTLLKKILHHRFFKAMRKFEKKHMKIYPSKAFSEQLMLERMGLRYDAAICGSDQVWSPVITGEDMGYFLDFCTEKTRRISYAPSFGIDEFSENFKNKIKKELDQYHAISVREASGKEMLDDLLHKDVPLVVDPTMLMNAEEWAEIEEEYPVKGDYIVYYTIRSSDALMKFCRELSRKTGLKVIIAGGNIIKKIKNRDPMLEYACDIGPSQWLYLIHNARYVITNSFHGTAFSINYRKNFFVEFSSFSNSRLSNIVSLAGLEDRIVRSPEVDSIPEDIDYTAVDERLAPLREESLAFLKNALS